MVILSKAVTIIKDAVIFSTPAAEQEKKAQSSQTHLAGAEPMRGQAKLGMYILALRSPCPDSCTISKCIQQIHCVRTGQARVRASRASGFASLLLSTRHAQVRWGMGMWRTLGAHEDLVMPVLLVFFLLGV